MNKVLNINLGGYAITIDDDAYAYLSAYFDSIRRRFSESEGRDEILHDIESRLGELITSNMGNRTIVMMPDVESAISVMGKPEDFGGEPVEKPGAKTEKIFRPGKKLFRDEQDAVIGGVCSGTAAYFGMQEPVWMRVIFVLLAIVSAGFWVPAYILLWILVPPARTAAERLAMRGEPVNVDNIAKEFEQGYERISNKVNSFSASGAGAAASNRAGQAASGCLSVLGKLVLGLFILIAASLILGLGATWVGGIFAFFTAAPYVNYFSPLSDGATYFGFFLLFLLLGIPVVGLCLWLGKTIFRFKTPAWLNSGLSVTWVLSFVSLIIMGAWTAGSFRESGVITKNYDLTGIPSDTLHVQWANEPARYDDEWWDNRGRLRMEGDRLLIQGMIGIRVHRSASGNFECTQSVRARGSSNSDAIDNAGQINFLVDVDKNKLLVPNNYSIPKGKKWRVQEIRLNIDVPVGKYIVFHNNIYQEAAADLDEYVDDIDGNYISNSPGRVYRMTSRGLECADCPRFGDRNYRSEKNYDNIILEGDFDAEIREGEDFSFHLEGNTAVRDQVQIIRTGNKITFTTNGKSVGKDVKVFIETPVFTNLYADNTGEVAVRGFDEGEASISAKGNSRIKAYLDVSSELEVSLSGKCTLELTGKGGSLDANLSEGAILEAGSWRANDVTLKASDSSRARVFADHDADLKYDASSQVKVDGNGSIRRNEN